MKKVQLHLKENSYQIIIGNRILSKLGDALSKLNIGRDAVIITNTGIAQHHANKLIAGLHKNGFSTKILTVPAGERSKSAQTAFALMGKIAAYDVKRKVFLIAFGGGVVGDLVGYVAAAYKRGIPYVQVPTTLLAQVDSAIGGKVGVDLSIGKNLIGAFYQPRIVWSDVAVLSTLTERQIRNGLAEAVKYGVIIDRRLFEYLEKNHKRLLDSDPRSLEYVVQRCSRIKAQVVSRDERETKGLRTILNFGHTIGHAIEAASDYSHYQHGEAVALGMRVAAELSWRMGLFSAQSVLRLEKLLNQIGLPTRIRKVGIGPILKKMAHDKKFKGGRNRFVVAVSIGQVKVMEEIPAQLINESIQSCI